jgi:hypothetical protein
MQLGSSTRRVGMRELDLKTRIVLPESGDLILEPADLIFEGIVLI